MRERIKNLFCFKLKLRRTPLLSHLSLQFRTLTLDQQKTHRQNPNLLPSHALVVAPAREHGVVGDRGRHVAGIQAPDHRRIRRGRRVLRRGVRRFREAPAVRGGRRSFGRQARRQWLPRHPVGRSQQLPRHRSVHRRGICFYFLVRLLSVFGGNVELL